MNGVPTLDDIFGWVKSGELASDPRAMVRASPEVRALAPVFKRLFSSADGKIVLETLANASVRRAGVDHRLSGQEYFSYAQLRQGQDQLFATIATYLEVAEELEKGDHDEHRDTPGRGPASSGSFNGYATGLDGDTAGERGDDGDDGGGDGPRGFDPNGEVAVR